MTYIASTAGMIRSAAASASRIAATLVGVWAGAVAPVDAAVDASRNANAASGHLPNMDPGVLLFVAMMFAAAVVAMILLAELVRCWALGGAPLKLLSQALLGVVAAAPIGLSLTVDRFYATGAAVLGISGAVILLFYAVMGLWSSRRRTGTARSSNEA